MRTVKYTGPYPRVEYKGQEFKRGEATNTDIEGELPWDFEITMENKILKPTTIPRFSDIEDLRKIEGIGPKTIGDIKIIFDNIEALKAALQADKVPLRDDVVEILRKELSGGK